MADQLHDVDASLDPRAALAPARDPLRRLLATGAWLWLVRPGAVEATAPLGLVLLDGLPRFLDALGAGAFRHG